ncbi:hypothetical protein BOTNAR_0446g00050 [Botryotinia narcissicola]|uniref:Uncharacterized protein n=1 Tax=Botryotinia narcissicola TaxID=278944 RepID=A0A4Z1HWC8_9HELO|nr:hypothetical protein BOTNAR_0446g00050 [Botryotinia narcissicola]
MKKFDIFVETVNSIPQPHHKADMVCYVCDDARSIKSVLEAAREGCCLCTLAVQAIAAMNQERFGERLEIVWLKVKDIGGIQRYSIMQIGWDGMSFIELYRNAFEPEVKNKD